MQTIKLATIGCGYFSKFHHNAWQRLDVDHVAVCDLDLTRAEEFKREYEVGAAFDRVDQMLERCQPNLVDIILPPGLHSEIVAMALAAGANVICQKPFTESRAQAQALIALAAQSERQLVIHENFRFQPWYMRIKQAIDEGLLGQIYQAHFALRPGDGQGPDAYLDRQPYFQKMARFLIRETGIHFVDVFRFLLGEPSAVYADLRQLNPAIAGEDAGQFILEFATDVRAVFDGNRLSDHAANNCRLTMGEMTVEGSAGVLRLNGDGEIQFRAHGELNWSGIVCNFNSEHFGGDCVYLLQEAVINCLQRGEIPPNHGEAYLKNLQIQEAIYASASSGQRQLL